MVTLLKFEPTEEAKTQWLNQLSPGDLFVLLNIGADKKIFQLLTHYGGDCGSPDAIEVAMRGWVGSEHFVYVNVRTGEVFTSKSNLRVQAYYGELILKERTL